MKRFSGKKYLRSGCLATLNQGKKYFKKRLHEMFPRLSHNDPAAWRRRGWGAHYTSHEALPLIFPHYLSDEPHPRLRETASYLKWLIISRFLSILSRNDRFL
jgi:hypothetical protein